ncbi:MAG: 3-deoxy-D-manno-octulosonic acid transferase [Muribaculaceae bacterium]|nr:3-deoxy-D-manno-octulosonic acid transferase [Muribaculaceae bacterium]
MNALYNAGMHLYTGAAHLAGAGSVKIRHMLAGQAETPGRLAALRDKLAPGGFDVWIHAASLGEFEQSRPVIEALLKNKPELSILLSFFSPSGYEVRHNFDPRVGVVYLPFDTPDKVSRFLDAASPRMAIFVKYEFWGNYLTELHKRHIPTYIISSIFRSKQIFFRPWGGMFRKMLRCFDHIFVQDDRSRRLLSGIGIDNVTVAGDTRFDRVTAICSKQREMPEADIFMAAHKDSFTMVFGSSWEKDEDVYMPVLREHKDVCAIIAPHEFDSQRLELMAKRLGKDETMLYSELSKLYSESPDKAREAAGRARFLIVDCFGLLSSLYRYADAAYIGGGFGTGIHNINEAAVYGIPVVFGPNYSKFNEATELIARGGAFSISDSRQFGKLFGRLISDGPFRTEAGRKSATYIASKVGATATIMKDIFKIEP